VTALLPLLDAADRVELTKLGRLRRVSRGAWLLSQGDPGDSVAVILTGRVKIAVVTPDGRDRACAVHGPGSVIGHFEALDPDGLGRTASAIALDELECRLIDGGEFRAFLRDRPEAGFALLRATIRVLRTADRRRADIADGGVTRHLARVLLEQIEMQSEAGETSTALGFGLTQAELAGILSVSRATIVRGLSVLRRQGAVATSPRQIIVTDIAALRDAAR
jgi:CRP/FNR family transcriptional regulator